MFSGIVETLGTIKDLQQQGGSITFSIQPQQSFDDLTIGASIAINGICLTVTDFTDNLFYVTAVPETLRLTHLSTLTVSDEVNLERSITLATRLGGHLIQGHIDAKGRIIALTDEGNATWLTIQVPIVLMKYIAKKGYIGIDGMSITVVETGDDFFSVTLIPHTKAVTRAKFYQIGMDVNIETDILARHIEKLLGNSHNV